MWCHFEKCFFQLWGGDFERIMLKALRRSVSCEAFLWFNFGGRGVFGGRYIFDKKCLFWTFSLPLSFGRPPAVTFRRDCKSRVESWEKGSEWTGQGANSPVIGFSCCWFFLGWEKGGGKL